MQHIYLSNFKLLGFSIQHRSSLVYQNLITRLHCIIRVELGYKFRKQNGIKALDGLMVTMLVRGILLAFPGFLCPRCLKFDFHRIMLINGAEPERMLRLLAGRKRSREWTKELDFFCELCCNEATKDGRTVRNNYSRILQTLNNRNSYLIIGEYTLLCFFMHYVWMKVSLVLVIGFNFVNDLDLENCFYFFVIIVSFKKKLVQIF